jgi:hypothetical protein
LKRKPGERKYGKSRILTCMPGKKEIENRKPKSKVKFLGKILGRDL